MVRRIAVAAMVIAGGAGILAGLWLQRQDERLAAAQVQLSAALAQMTLDATKIAAAQQAYVAPGQPREQWAARTQELVGQLVGSSAAVQLQLRSAEAAGLLQTFSGAVDSLVMIDERIRANLAIGQDLSASDLIFTEGRDTVDLLIATSRALASSELARSNEERSALLTWAWTAAAVIIVIWLVGVIVLVRRGRNDTHQHSTAPAVVVPPEMPVEPAIESGPRPSSPADDADLDAAVAICVDLSRLTNVDELPDLFARMAVALDASGIILWLARGEELFALTAHGYDPKVLSRLGPIGRQANNATAQTWRSGEVTIVSGDNVSNGAVVAPVWSADGCVGVLAAEVRHSRESNRSAAAITTMFAAQLATLVTGLPMRNGAAASGPGSEPPLAASL